MSHHDIELALQSQHLWLAEQVGMVRADDVLWLTAYLSLASAHQANGALCFKVWHACPGRRYVCSVAVCRFSGRKRTENSTHAWALRVFMVA